MHADLTDAVRQAMWLAGMWLSTDNPPRRQALPRRTPASDSGKAEPQTRSDQAAGLRLTPRRLAWRLIKDRAYLLRIAEQVEEAIASRGGGEHRAEKRITLGMTYQVSSCSPARLRATALRHALLCASRARSCW